MSHQTWTDVDAYLTDRLIGADPILHQVLVNSDAGELPQISVSPTQGKLLNMLCTIHGAKRILEIGTLGGYSTIWLARALPADGKLVTLEAIQHHADVAKSNIALAGLGEIVEQRVGLGVDLLEAMVASNEEPFDLVFIDADKANMPSYLDFSLKLSRVGTVIVSDNVVRDGAVIDFASEDPNIQGVQKLLNLLQGHPRLTTTAIQTVGSKGYDGFAISIVTS